MTTTTMTTQRTGFSTAEVFWDKGETLSVRVGGVSVPTVSTAEVPGTLLGTSFWVEPVEELHQVTKKNILCNVTTSARWI